MNSNQAGSIRLRFKKNVNKEDVFCACERRGLNSSDLMRISDNIEDALTKFNIRILPNSTTLKNKAKFSKEYQTLKTYRSNDKAALHDAMAILYVREKRGGRAVKSFEKVNCWFVNNSITHDFEHSAIENIISGNSSENQPEIIKADDLLNILWLSAPSIRSEVSSDEMVDIGLTTLVAHTLNKALPKARIIRELDENIQKYKSEDLTDRDVYLLSVRIANNQVKNIEELNTLAVNNAVEFNCRVKEEARKQAEIEKEQRVQLNKLYSELSNAIHSVSKQSEAMALDKEVLNKKNQSLQEKLKKSESDYEAICKESGIKDTMIKRQRKIIFGLLAVIAAIIIFVIFHFLPIAKWLKVIIDGICSLGGLWGLISLIINIVKTITKST